MKRKSLLTHQSHSPFPRSAKQISEALATWNLGLLSQRHWKKMVNRPGGAQRVGSLCFPWGVLRPVKGNHFALTHVGIFDLRQRQLRHTFLAHDAPVKSIVVDENEEFFISGSEDGDIKVTTSCTSKLRAIEMFTFYWGSNMFSRHCLVPVRRFARPSRSIHFGNVSEANWRKTSHFFARTTWPETH